MIELAPSILSADFAHLGEQVARAVEGGATVVHVDIMDGHFVPNLTIGPPGVKSLRKATDLPLDCHLMIENPDEFIPAFVEAGANWVSVHQEACIHLDRTLHHIREHGALAGVINPATQSTCFRKFSISWITCSSCRWASEGEVSTQFLPRYVNSRSGPDAD